MNQLHQTLTQKLHQIHTLHTQAHTLHAQPHLKANHYTHTPKTHHTHHATPQETHHRRLEEINTHWNNLKAIATAWAHTKGETTNISPALYLAANLQWAHKNWENLTHLEKTVNQAHHYYQKLLGETPQPSNHLCPICGQTKLYPHPNQQGYYCPDTTCDYYGTPQQVHNATLWKITSLDWPLTRAQASELFNIPRPRIRWHIHAGNLHPTPKGLLHPSELLALPYRNKLH